MNIFCRKNNWKLGMRRAQGLLETIVAMSVLITGIVSLMSMGISSSTSRSANELATVAANLAREGIEVVIAKRNSNWMIDQPFDTGLYSGTDYTFGLDFDPTTSAWTLVSGVNAINDALAAVYIFPKAAYTGSDLSGLMVQNTVASAPAANGVTAIASNFSRMVTLDPICYDAAANPKETTVVSGSSCSGTTTKIGMRVTSLVQWSDRGMKHNVSVIETLYDWK